MILNDEIDLNNLFYKLWRGKIYIILIMLFSIFIGSKYIQSVERKYTVEYKLKPVSNEAKPQTSLAQYSGIARYAGISLPKNHSTDFYIFQELLTSVETAKMIMKNKQLIKNIYLAEWNEAQNAFSKPKEGKITLLKNNIKNWLTGDKILPYISPNEKRLSNFLTGSLRIIENQENGFITIKSETSDPEKILQLIVEAAEASDEIMRNRYIAFSNDPLAFYKKKLLTARSREHREALAALIAKEEQNLMLASRGRHFVAEPYLSPTISSHPTSPKSMLAIQLSILIGLFLGSTTVLLFGYIREERL